MGFAAARVRRIMPQPFRHPKTGVLYYRKVVPEPLRKALGRTEFRVSLRTKDAREAKRRYPEIAADVERKLAQAATGQSTLTERQTFALAGEWYREQLAEREDNPGDPDALLGESGMLPSCEGELAETGDHGRAVREITDQLLRNKGLTVDRETRRRLADAVYGNYVRLLLTLEKRAEGDYSPDPHLNQIPAWQPPEAAQRAPSRTAFSCLLDDWARERQPPERTRYEWQRALNRLAAHVGHDDAARLTRADIVSWKDALLVSGKSAKTVFNHLAAARALFNWARRNERLTANPVAGVQVGARRRPSERRLPFDDADAARILSAARNEQGARRWVPWLLAFTGARLEEVCQAFVADIRQQDGIWYLDINADHPTKSLKNPGCARKVPLHHAILEEGFLDHVRALPQDGPLFPDLTPDRFGRRGGNGTKIIGRWVRSLGITDRRKAPNHSWRHRFKDQCRAAGVEKSVHDALTGHVSGDVGDGYGLGYPLRVLADAVAKLPVPEGIGRPAHRQTGRRRAKPPRPPANRLGAPAAAEGRSV